MLRQQYHFRRSERGDLLVWDVNKLNLKTRSLTPKKIKLSDVKEYKQTYWYDLDLGAAKPTCENIVEHVKLINMADLNYPIILCCEGKLMDGMHRVCKAHLFGNEEILAFRFEEYICPDFVNIDYKDLKYD